MTLQPKLIALCGAKGVGKSTYASRLAGQSGHVYSFATPLKTMLMSVFPSEYILKQKEVPIPDFEPHVTGRFLMQTLGTDWARRMVDAEIWLKMLRQRLIEDDKTKSGLKVVDDLRFSNEAVMIRELGGQVWRIKRRSYVDVTDDHVSEQGIPDDLIDREVTL